MGKLRFISFTLILSLSVMLLSNALGPISVQEASTYGYDGYIPPYYPYSNYMGYSTTSVRISVSGLPSDYSAAVKIDGNDAGTVQGGSSKSLQISGAGSHSFQVEDQISGGEGVR